MSPRSGYGNLGRAGQVWVCVSASNPFSMPLLHPHLSSKGVQDPSMSPSIWQEGNETRWIRCLSATERGPAPGATGPLSPPLRDSKPVASCRTGAQIAPGKRWEERRDRKASVRTIRSTSPLPDHRRPCLALPLCSRNAQRRQSPGDSRNKAEIPPLGERRPNDLFLEPAALRPLLAGGSNPR